MEIWDAYLFNGTLPDVIWFEVNRYQMACAI